MIHLTQVLLPILLSAVLVFVASSIIHMATPWHKNDYNSVPKQDEVMAALRPFNIPPGDYMVPRPASMQEMKSAEFQAKAKAGPSFVMTMFPTMDFGMGKQLASWFLYCVVVGLIAAHVAMPILPAGSEYKMVFHTVGLAAFAGYGLGIWQMTIWYRRSLGTTIRSTIDALIFAMLTAGTFGWLWPK